MGKFCVLLTLSRPEIEQRALEANFDPVVFGLKLGVSQRTLERQSRKRFSCTFKQALEKFRLNLALKLVTEAKSTKEIAVCLGYKQESHFCRRFKRVAHCTFGEAKELIKAGIQLELFAASGGKG